MTWPESSLKRAKGGLESHSMFSIRMKFMFTVESADSIVMQLFQAFCVVHPQPGGAKMATLCSEPRTRYKPRQGYLPK